MKRYKSWRGRAPRQRRASRERLQSPRPENARCSHVINEILFCALSAIAARIWGVEGAIYHCAQGTAHAVTWKVWHLLICLPVTVFLWHCCCLHKTCTLNTAFEEQPNVKAESKHGQSSRRAPFRIQNSKPFKRPRCATWRKAAQRRAAETPASASEGLLLAVGPELASAGRVQREPGGRVRALRRRLPALPAAHVGGAVPGPPASSAMPARACGSPAAACAPNKCAYTLYHGPLQRLKFHA